MLLIRHTAVWEGTIGLPGYSQFYQAVTDPPSTSAQNGHTAIRSFFSNVSAAIPGEVTVTVDPIYQTLDEVTGDIVAEATVGAPSQVVQGVNGDGYSAQVGVLIEWLTGSYIDGRRLRGRTYLVPLAGQFDTDGTLTTGGLAILNAAWPWITADQEDFRVWHRPVNGAGGSSATITSGVVKDHACILRSRMR